MRMHHSTSRRGSIAPLIAIALVPVLAIAALAIDGGLQLDYKRQTYAAADASALAAAADLFKNYDANKGYDTNGTAAASAKTTASAHGYTNGANNALVNVFIPPKTGPFTDKPEYAEVTIQYNMPRYFSSILGTTALPVYSRAVARGAYKNIGVGIQLT